MKKDLLARIDALSGEIKQLKSELDLQREAAMELRVSEKRYRSIFDGASIGLAQIAPDGRFLEVNRSLCAMLGYDAQELLRQTHAGIMPVEDRAADQSQRNRLLTGETPRIMMEKRYLRRDGTILWANVTLTLARNEANQASYFLASIENVSERRGLEETLRRLASNLAKANLVSLAGTWQWNVETGQATASPEVLQLFGFHQEQPTLPLDAFLARISSNDRSSVNAAMVSALSGDVPYHVEYRIQLPDGQERLILASGEVYRRAENGKPLVMIGMLQDITARRRAEQALKESERLFRELYDNAVDGIFIANTDGKYIDANTSACRLLGYSHDELVRKSIVDLIPVQDRERLARTKAFLLKNADHFQLDEWELKSRQGTYIPVEISARILPDGRWMAIVRDISERKRTQAELLRYAQIVQDLYENAPCGYHSVDASGAFVQINQTELNWLGYTADELIGKKKISDLMTESSRIIFQEQFPIFLKTGRSRDLEFEFVRKDGSILPVLHNSTAVYDEQGKFVRSRTSLFDISALVAAQKKLRQAATVFEHTSEAILITNSVGTIVAVNNAFSRITGYQPEEVIGKTPRLLKSERQNDDFYRKFWGALEQTGTWQGEIWDRKKSGELFPAWETVTAVRDHSGKITDYISVFSDITTIKETEQKLIQLAYHDNLTGLPNRLLFNDRMNHAIAQARRHGKRAALLLLDLDRFKLINDTLGHAAGDELLQAISSRLREVIREEDTVARLGGDEFAVILGHLKHLDDVALLAQKLITVISRPVCIAGQTLTVSTSIGIGIYPDDADNAEALSKSADMALYGAKDKGRNAYEFYTPEMTRMATETLRIDRGLRRAVKRNELALYYQPQISLASRRIVALEALLRWNNPVQGSQSPGVFIPIAEETNLIETIGDWVFDTAWEQLEQWRSLGIPPIRLAVNMSVRQIKNPKIVDEIRKKLLCAPLNDFELELEITESALQTETETVEALQELKSLGLKIAIDDFGTGYSSLSSLKHLPIDMLKIDRSFIHGLPCNPDDSAITSAIIAMGHKLEMGIIAEGVETPEQLRFLSDHQCDIVQGFLFFPPLPAEECGEILMRDSIIDVERNGHRLSA